MLNVITYLHARAFVEQLSMMFANKVQIEDQPMTEFSIKLLESFQILLEDSQIGTNSSKVNGNFETRARRRVEAPVLAASLFVHIVGSKVVFGCDITSASVSCTGDASFSFMQGSGQPQLFLKLHSQVL